MSFTTQTCCMLPTICGHKKLNELDNSKMKTRIESKKLWKPVRDQKVWKQVKDGAQGLLYVAFAIPILTSVGGNTLLI